MWQRKQTLFLLGSVIAVVLCLFFPIGAAKVGTLKAEVALTNLGWASGGAVPSVVAWPLFLIISLVGIISLATIFLFKNRRLQMRLCRIGEVICFVWYIYYIYLYNVISAQTDFSFKPAAFLPVVSWIFLFLAYLGVRADERLVRSMDRIR